MANIADDAAAAYINIISEYNIYIFDLDIREPVDPMALQM